MDNREYRAYVGGNYRPGQHVAAIYQDYQIWGQGSHGLPAERIGTYNVGPNGSYISAWGNGKTVDQDFSGSKAAALALVVRQLLNRTDVHVEES